MLVLNLFIKKKLQDTPILFPNFRDVIPTRRTQKWYEKLLSGMKSYYDFLLKNLKSSNHNMSLCPIVDFTVHNDRHLQYASSLSELITCVRVFTK